MSVLRQIATGSIGSWGHASLHARCRAVVLVLTLPVAAFFMLDSAQKPTQWVALFEKMSEQEAVALRTMLETKHVPFEMDDGGQTILVPAARSAELRVEFTNRVLPRLRFEQQQDGVIPNEDAVLRGAPSSERHPGYFTAPAQEHETERGAA